MKEEEFAEVLRKENEEFRRLDAEHRKLESALAALDKKFHLTADEEVERKRVQKLKLSKKDRMSELVRTYKQGLTD